MCRELFLSSDAPAYSGTVNYTCQGPEGYLSCKITLPSVSLEARRHGTGKYYGVRYRIYTKDGSAEAPDDYYPVKKEWGWKWPMVKGDGGYKWSANLTYNVKKDGVPEGREWFWLYLETPK